MTSWMGSGQVEVSAGEPAKKMWSTCWMVQTSAIQITQCGTKRPVGKTYRKPKKPTEPRKDRKSTGRLVAGTEAASAPDMGVKVIRPKVSRASEVRSAMPSSERRE